MLIIPNPIPRVELRSFIQTVRLKGAKLCTPASLICVQKDTVIEVNKLLFKFIWKGKDRVKRLSLVSDLDKGGLKAPHLESIIKSQRIMCC